MPISLSIDFEMSEDCKEIVIQNNHNHDGNSVTSVTADVFRGGNKIKSGIPLSVSTVQNNNVSNITTKEVSGTANKEVFKDGVYQVRLDVDYSGSTYSTNDRDISYCNAYDCIVGKVGKAALENCDCEDKKVEDTWDLYMMLQGAIHLFSCGDYTSAQSQLSKANALCETDCGC